MNFFRTTLRATSRREQEVSSHSCLEVPGSNLGRKNAAHTEALCF